MHQSIALVGPGDRQVEQVLRARGFSVSLWMDRELAQRAQQASAATHYVLIDLRDRTSLPAGMDAFCRQHPSVPLMLLVSSLDPTTILAAMRAGVKEVLQYPFTGEELDAAIARLAAAKDSGPGGNVVAFIGAKGGVGSTTAAVKVATELARLRRGSVLLVDAPRHRRSDADAPARLADLETADAGGRVQAYLELCNDLGSPIAELARGVGLSAVDVAALVSADDRFVRLRAEDNAGIVLARNRYERYVAELLARVRGARRAAGTRRG